MFKYFSKLSLLNGFFEYNFILFKTANALLIILQDSEVALHTSNLAATVAYKAVHLQHYH